MHLGLPARTMHPCGPPLRPAKSFHDGGRNSVAKSSPAKAALDFIKKHGAKIVDFKFIDMPGMWQHTSVPVSEVDENAFIHGIGFDGSSIRGFQAIQESDMIMLAEPSSARVDSFCSVPT